MLIKGRMVYGTLEYENVSKYNIHTYTDKVSGSMKTIEEKQLWKKHPYSKKVLFLN